MVGVMWRVLHGPKAVQCSDLIYASKRAIQLSEVYTAALDLASCRYLSVVFFNKQSQQTFKM